jgi:hypothetical protein
VESNIKGYTTRQQDRAWQALELYHIIGTQSMDAYKAIIKGNLIRNCPVTIDDIKLTDRMFGPSILALKGKSTRKTTPSVQDDIIEIEKI